jgi:hypothetical protein
MDPGLIEAHKNQKTGVPDIQHCFGVLWTVFTSMEHMDSCNRILFAK